MDTIKEQFNSISKQYDAQRKHLIPCFYDFYTSCLPIIDTLTTAKKVLDIGAGTGLFSQFVYEQRNDLHFTLIDISTEMLSVAKKRFNGLNNFEFLEQDFSIGPIAEKYDLIISALAIHHLEDEQKATLYRSVFNALHPGGVFINADQVEGRTPWYDSYYKSKWKETVLNSDLDQQAAEQAFERIKLDKFAKLEIQLQMLENAGFSQTDCIYKYNNFVVMSAMKTA
ncbi:class I SAM-dependent methyltransferase [Pedobacter cryoconitis]|uniref:tRNA (Cmo5U34)-methyltransferase n=1 Tax=Pedobacter cryoconitis TaxID=188932 RepID=A0A327SUS7_9SPHI|nr:class I SAM-dependent methyltransferase [Pedobacter cryoconitis]RAJ33096.1 tRNA (cmo5U34)-methyltransferase [Pedobacter cryoconitis]